jgi:DNA-binding response OmpR family regulator
MLHRILVVDDDIQLVRLLQSYLEHADYQVSTATDGEEAWKRIRTERPDLILLDLQLPKRDGWEITRQLRNEPSLSTIPLMIVTARIDDSDKILGLELGADDYITKPFNPREVLARVRAVLRRTTDTTRPSSCLSLGSLSLDPDRHRVTLDQAELELTPTEFVLLQSFLEYPDHAFTRRELIERALGYDYEGLERTLDSHVKNLRRKIEISASSPVHIETVYGIGYRLQVNTSVEEESV